jgi:Amt family ammonium transporter
MGEKMLGDTKGRPFVVFRRRGWIVLAAIALLVFLGGPLSAQSAATLDGVAAAAKDATSAVNIMWMLLGGFLVFFMQAGFALVETGFTRTKNVAHTMMMNMMVFCIGAIGYWLVGFAFQFGAVNQAYAAVSRVGTVAGA